MGLYGSASPLPTFYTEELLDDYRNDMSAAKAFFDLVGQIFFIRYYQALTKYRLLDRVIREREPLIKEQLFSLFGIGHPELLGDHRLSDGDIACTGLFPLTHRPASGLRSYLATRFSLEYEQIEIEQCLGDYQPVPEDQQAFLGLSSTTLGEDAVIGRVAPDRMGSIRICLRELDSDVYHSFLPGRSQGEDLRWAIEFYAGTAIRCEIRLYLKTQETQTARVGGIYWSELGGDAFLGIEENEEEHDLAGCGFSQPDIAGGATYALP